VGGGFGTVDPAINESINVSGPVDGTGLTARTRTGDRPREWYPGAYSGSGNDQEFKSFAICSASAKARLRVATFTVPLGKTRSKVVSCPRGKHALGGGLGLATSPVEGVYEESSGPLDRSGQTGSTNTGDVARKWRVAVYNGLAPNLAFKALVICSSQGSPKIVSENVNVGPFEDVEATALCPAGKRALGGGVSVIGRPTVNLQHEANGPPRRDVDDRGNG
jgi:hypothetical protein